MKPKNTTIQEYGNYVREMWMIKNENYNIGDRPSLIRADGQQEWYLNGVLHNANGPAVICRDRTKFWYLNGKHYTEKKFNDKMDRLKELEEILKGITG